MNNKQTSRFEVFTLEPFPEVKHDACLADLIVHTAGEGIIENGDILVVASKVVSIEEGRRVKLKDFAPTKEAIELAAQVGKDPHLIQVILSESASFRLATPRGPIIAFHRLGFELTSAGVDRDTEETAYLLPIDPDASATRLRAQIKERIGQDVAVIVADSDGRPDREGATVIAIGSSGITPLRTSETISGGNKKLQKETLADMLAAAAGIVIGQRGRGAPIAVIRGVRYEPSVEGLKSIIHKAPR